MALFPSKFICYLLIVSANEFVTHLFMTIHLILMNVLYFNSVTNDQFNTHAHHNNVWQSLENDGIKDAPAPCNQTRVRRMESLGRHISYCSFEGELYLPFRNIIVFMWRWSFIFSVIWLCYKWNVNGLKWNVILLEVKEQKNSRSTGWDIISFYKLIFQMLSPYRNPTSTYTFNIDWTFYFKRFPMKNLSCNLHKCTNIMKDIERII